MDKFGALAASMYFTPDGLEQATRLSVASHRAARLTAFGASTVVDLGCGIGGDLIAFARAGLTAAGVDLDPVRVAVAEANLAALGLPGAVGVADALDTDIRPFDVAFADPARRTGRGRTFSPDAWTPPWSFVESLLAGRRLREDRARHPPRAASPPVSRRSGSATTARSRRPRSGAAGSPRSRGAPR